MSIKCSLLGHRFGETTVERDREEEGSEVVITITELESCTRCGETRVVSENKEVTTLETPDDAASPATADSSATSTNASVSAEASDGASSGDDRAPSGDDAEILDAEGGESSAQADARGAPTSIPDAEADATDDSPPDDGDDAVIIDGDDSPGGTDESDGGASDERRPGQWPDEVADDDEGAEFVGGPGGDVDAGGSTRDGAGSGDVDAGGDVDTVGDARAHDDVEAGGTVGGGGGAESGGNVGGGGTADGGEDAETNENVGADGNVGAGSAADAGGEVDGSGTAGAGGDPETGASSAEAGAGGTPQSGGDVDSWPEETTPADAVAGEDAMDDWPDETKRDSPGDAGAAGPSLEDTESPTIPVPEGMFKCSECGFTTEVESSSLRAGDFCPDCRQGTLLQHEDEAE